MRPLQRLRPSPPADAGIRLPCSGPCECRDVWGPEPAANLKIFRNCHFFQNDYFIAKHSCIKAFHIH
ncbi:unnamed protein product, partial [Staurois parvus]